MKKFQVLILIFVVLIAGALFFWNDILNFYSSLSLVLPGVEEGVGEFITKQIEKQILTPPPLRSGKENPEAFLTKEGVINWTNAQRQENGLPPLKENTKLNASAKLKVEDMFAKQYFAHNSPSGQGVADLAEKAGYDFIVIGENLASGNYKDDQDLVQAWMDSPGHRENILYDKYQEIGVWVQKGVFEGETTWLAVQHFGLPLSACPTPNDALKITIEENKNQLAGLKTELESLKAEIEPIRPKRDPDFYQKVRKYNEEVSQYNELLQKTESLMSSYNFQVQSFNQCVSQNQQ